MGYVHRYRILMLLPFILMAGNAYGQDDQDSVRVDTVRNRFLPTGIRVGTDVINHVKTRTQNNFDGWEIQGDIDFHRYYAVLEFGSLGRTLNADSANYRNEGTFWRAGIDVNFLTSDPDRNVFFLGARYGQSVFTESMSLVAYDPIWGHLSETFHHSDVKASWIELTTGLRVKIWKIFWLGYTGRLKFALATDGTPEMLPHDVPGFGRTNKETTWGFNYYLMIRLPLRKAPPPPPEGD